MQQHYDKLRELDPGEILFPPNFRMRAAFGQVHRNQVIRIHHSMDERIQNQHEITAAIKGHIHIHPIRKVHKPMVPTMQERELLRFATYSRTHY